MHPPSRRVAAPSGLVPVALMFFLGTCLPQMGGLAHGELPHHLFAQTEIAGSARRLPTEARPTDQSPRVGGQPRQVSVAHAAQVEVVVAPLPDLLMPIRFETPGRGMESHRSLARPRSPKTRRLSDGEGFAGEYAAWAEAGCGLEGCVSCTSGPWAGSGDAGDGGLSWDGGLSSSGGLSSNGGLSDWNSTGGNRTCGAEPVEPVTCKGGCGIGPRACESKFLCLAVPRIQWCRSEFFGGVQSFAGPANYAGVGTDPNALSGSSSFGIHHGMNATRPLALLDNQASAQLGIRGVVSDFEGANFTDKSRRQVFVTGGFFRRADYGLQGGVVADYLHDDWYYELHLTQLRGEVSWKTAGSNEFGYGYMAGLTDDGSRTTITSGGAVVADRIEAEAVNQNRLFYRRHFRVGGFFEAFGGISGDDDGLLGASMELLLRDALALRSGVSYLVPKSSDDRRDHQEASWNLGISLVWYPCGGCDAARYQRPLMDVSDNGTFMFDRR